MMRQLLFLVVLPFTFPALALPSQTLAELRKANGILIDVRQSSSYNGWRVDVGAAPSTAATSGHEKGALNLAASWVKNSDTSWFKQRFKIPSEQAVGLYGEPKDVEAVAGFLRGQGLRKLFVIKDALRDSTRLERLPHYQKLVPTWWLARLLKGQAVEAPPAKDFKVIELAWGPPKDYLLAHIPGAFYLDTDNFEEGPVWNKLEDPRLLKNLLKLGLTKNTPVILYSRDTLAAARVAAILLYAGLDDVRLLDGGWPAWSAASLPSERGDPPKMKPADSFGGAFPGRPQVFASLEQARQMLKEPKQNTLVSIRSWKEFIGETSGYADISEKGDIAGALWGHAGSDANHMEDFRNPDNTMRAPSDINSFWREKGIVPEKNVSFYCGTGWRAAEAYFYASVMGWPRISIFDGGWKEWSMDPRNPVARGPR